MPLKNSLEFGDLYINFKVVLPDTLLTPEQAQIIKPLLAPAPALSPEDEKEEIHVLTKVEQHEEDEEEAYGDEEGHFHGDEDDEGHGGSHEDEEGDEGAGGPGCTQQ